MSRVPIVPGGTPSAEVAIDHALVTALLRAQHPDLADLPIRPAHQGWDNVMVRLGERWAVRLPRRASAAPLLRHEQQWLGVLAPTLPLPIPAAVRLGAPDANFPWPWSVVPWLAGDPVETAAPDGDQAPVLAGFLRALHRTPPASAPINMVRGCPLADRDRALHARVERLGPTLIDAGLLAIWQRALDAPANSAPTWIHGDLHGRNVLASAGRLSAIVDWGDLAQGDPATDLASIWILFADSADRRRVMAAYGADSADCWIRARGWALMFGVIFLDAGNIDGDSATIAMGQDILRRVAEGP